MAPCSAASGVDVWGTGYLDGKNVQLAIAQALTNFTGVLPNGYIVLSIWLGVELDDFESASRTYCEMVEYSVGYSF